MPDPLSELQRLGQEFDADAVEAVARAIRNAMNCGLTIEGERQFCNSCDCHDAARAAIEAARPMIEAEAWQPIESAPRDGAEFDVWVPNDTGGYRVTNLHLRGDGGYLWDRRMSIARIARWPTHWRPPPAPPSIEPQS